MNKFARQDEALPRVMGHSNRARWWWGGIAIAMLATVSTISAGNYRICSYSIDGGGGGVSAGNRFRIEGTVNQPSAGMPMAGLTYEVDGGFWSVPEEEGVVDPSTPVLSIQSIDPGKMSITWNAGTGRRWQLERSFGLSPAAWKAVPGAIQTPVVLPSSDTTTLFRLRLVE